MPIISDKDLYNYVKSEADSIYKKSSAYKSGYIVKRYKELGGRYKDDNKEKKLKRWFLEEWKDIGNKEYPVYRPTVKVNKNTPLTVNEIDKKNLQSQIKKKQIIKGEYNLHPFKPKKNYKSNLFIALRSLLTSIIFFSSTPTFFNSRLIFCSF